jgi:hypothetical protein
VDVKLLLNQKNYIYPIEQRTYIEINEKTENTRSRMYDNIQNHIRKEKTNRNIAFPLDHSGLQRIYKLDALEHQNRLTSTKTLRTDRPVIPAGMKPERLNEVNVKEANV